jgi:hypothetical protein
MSALPKAVQAQIDNANKLVAELYDKDGKLKGPPAAPAGDPPPDPAAAPSAAAPAAPADPAAPAAAGGPAPTPPPPASARAVDWEQRYRVLQGKYNAEVPRLTQQLQDMQRQLNGVQGLLASFQQRPPAPASSAPPAPLVKEEEIKEFGPDLYDFISRVAKQQQAALLPEIDRRIAPVVQKVDAVKATAENANQLSAAAQRRAMLDLLSQQVPNWQAMNEDPGFLAWLDQTDPYTGKVRGELLSAAEAANDGPRVVAFFVGYLKENATVAPATPAPAAAAPAAPAAPAASQPTLESLVAPGAPKPGAARAPDGSGKRVWTRAEIGKFYAEAAAGKYRSTEGQKRYREIETEIFAAQAEGRVRA